MKRVAYLGNIWEYPEALARMPGVYLAAVLYESEGCRGGSAEADGAAEAALRATRGTGARLFRVSTVEELDLALKSAGPIDLAVMANFGIILSEAALSLPGEGVINFHPGLLPGQAGRTPVARLWKAGGGDSGLTIHRATTQVDAGPVLGVIPGRVDAARPLEDNILTLFRLGIPHLPRVIFPSQSA